MAGTDGDVVFPPAGHQFRTIFDNGAYSVKIVQVDKDQPWHTELVHPNGVRDMPVWIPKTKSVRYNEPKEVPETIHSFVVEAVRTAALLNERGFPKHSGLALD